MESDTENAGNDLAYWNKNSKAMIKRIKSLHLWLDWMTQATRKVTAMHTSLCFAWCTILAGARDYTVALFVAA
ncbi:hypothetical protein FACS1894199_04950 [Bacteroidia bacterium]|nr:hypothetical protein FACS1894199_04950 [Bacteroidia bacterium]